MAPTVILKRMYSQELVLRAFQYFAASRSLYNRIRVDYQLQSIKTLTRITPKVSTFNETCFVRGVEKKNQKQCVITQHVTYEKKCCYIMEELYLVERSGTFFLD